MSEERFEKALEKYRKRYETANRKERAVILDEFCSLTEYHRKYAIALLGRRADRPISAERQRRGPTYSPAAIRTLERVWEASGRPWSVRLKAALPLWLPWARKSIRECTREVEEQLLKMSARQMDRRLAEKKSKLKHSLFGRTKPGTLLKHQITVKTDNWDVNEPGFCEIDLVSHSGPFASGEFLHSFNITDIHTGWCETRAIMGKGEAGVVRALEEMRGCLPFALKAIDSDNGSEFINYHLLRYCNDFSIQFTRGRPYKKNDNAHIEQKNWTHVRRIFGWERYDTSAQQELMNVLYCKELSMMMNFFQPSVKLVEKERIASKLRRRYDTARTPLDRLSETHKAIPALKELLELRANTNPFELSKAIDSQMKALGKLRK